MKKDSTEIKHQQPHEMKSIYMKSLVHLIRDGHSSE